MSGGAVALAVAALLVVALTPGAPWVALLRLRGALPASLLAPAAFVITVLFTTPAVAASLAFGWSSNWVAYWLCGVFVVGFVCAIWRNGWRRIVAATPLGLWWKITPLVALLALAVATAAAIVGGSLAVGDPLFHTALARKLIAIPHVGFAASGLFVDGSYHPGYLLPAWHEIVALSARLAGDDVLTAAYTAPIAVAGLSVLAISGLGGVVFRSARGAIVTAVAYVAADLLAGTPHFELLANGLSPSAGALGIAVPLALASFLAAIHAPKDKQRRRSLILLICAIVATAILHIDYIVWIGFATVGYLLAWIASLRPRRVAFARHFTVAILVAAVAGICFVAILPAISHLSSFHGDARAHATAFGNFREWLVGTQHTFHLRADLLAAEGPLAALGLAAALLAAVRLREPGLRLIIGTVGLVLIVGLDNTLFTGLANFASISQAKRLADAAPHDLGVALGLLALGAWVSRGRIWWRAVKFLVAVLVGIGVALAVHQYPVPDSPSDGNVFAHWPIIATAAAAVVLFAWGIITRPWAFRRRARVAAVQREDHARRFGAPPFALRGIGWVSIAVVVAGACWPLAHPAQRVLAHDLAHRPESAYRADSIAQLNAPIIVALRKLPAGSVVLAPVQLSLQVAAVAPVYIAAAPLAQVANTAKNRGPQRRALANRFYGHDASNPSRLAVLTSQHVDYVLVARSATAVVGAPPLITLRPDVFHLLAKGRTERLYALDTGTLGHRAVQ